MDCVGTRRASGWVCFYTYFVFRFCVVGGRDSDVLGRTETSSLFLSDAGGGQVRGEVAMAVAGFCDVM